MLDAESCNESDWVKRLGYWVEVSACCLIIQVFREWKLQLVQDGVFTVK